MGEIITELGAFLLQVVALDVTKQITVLLLCVASMLGYAWYRDRTRSKGGEDNKTPHVQLNGTQWTTISNMSKDIGKLVSESKTHTNQLGDMYKRLSALEKDTSILKDRDNRKRK